MGLHLGFCEQVICQGGEFFKGWKYLDKAKPSAGWTNQSKKCKCMGWLNVDVGLPWAVAFQCLIICLWTVQPSHFLFPTPVPSSCWVPHWAWAADAVDVVNPAPKDDLSSMLVA